MLEKAVRSLIEKHDAKAKKLGFRQCGCSACKELRPFVATGEQS